MSKSNHTPKNNYIKLGVLSHIESRYIPHTPTRTRLLLEILTDGLAHSTHELTSLLGANPRGPLQALTGNNYGYWNVVNVAGKSKMGLYQIDSRHLSRLEGDDSRARNEAQLAYHKHSREISENGVARHQKAVELEQYAQEKVEADQTRQLISILLEIDEEMAARQRFELRGHSDRHAKKPTRWCLSESDYESLTTEFPTEVWHE